MHRFFAAFNGEIGETVFMNPEDSLHAIRVLRMTPGETVELVSPPQCALATILSTEYQKVELRIDRILPSSEMRTRITLYQGLPKSDKLEWIVQKGTELGCARFVPVVLKRSIAQADRKENVERKTERLRKIAREAVKQCGRSDLPEVLTPLRLTAALPIIEQEDILLIPWEEESACSLSCSLADVPNGARIGIFIGPEGGIDPEEIETLRALPGTRVITLGPRILRTETAAIATIAAVGYQMGEWNP